MHRSGTGASRCIHNHAQEKQKSETAQINENDGDLEKLVTKLITHQQGPEKENGGCNPRQQQNFYGRGGSIVFRRLTLN